MRKFKLFYYVILFGYIFVSIYFALYIEYMFKQFGMFGFLKFLQYWALAGIVILFLEWMLENIHLLQLRNKNKKQASEIVTLKSEMYELQKAANKEQAPVEISEKSDDDPKPEKGS